MKKNLESIINVILGTAGHIDHGKSKLVERLTGLDPDRLPEEKARGLTIDLGFAPLRLKGGQQVGIIDVPGHERLIKNMVAGATGIDLVLLVVAADDGVMPQTREHLAIMHLLGLKQGIVVINKIDLVEEDLRELVKEEVRETLKGTFLEDAPVLEVSALTGAGVDELLAEIHSRVSSLEPKPSTGIFRMPIQRVFSSKGFGTVVTGVPLQGQTTTGETLEVVPLGKTGRVRGIHAYGEPTDLARAGHSSAINLTDIDYKTVARGMVVTQPGYFRGSTMFEARFHYLPSCRRALIHQSSIRLHVGTVEGLGKIYLLEKKALQPGEDAYVQFRLREPVVAAPGDRFVARLHSPLETIGGGEILDRSRWRLKTGKPRVIDLLHEKESALGSPKKLLANSVQDPGRQAVSEKELTVRCGLHADEAKVVVADLLAEGTLVRASRAGCLLSAKRLEEAQVDVLERAKKYFHENPRSLSLGKLQLRQAINADEVFFQDLLKKMESEGLATEARGGHIRFRDFGPTLTPEDERIRDQITEALKEKPFSPPSPTEIAGERGLDRTVVGQITALLEESGVIHRLAADVFLHQDALEEARQRLRQHLEKNHTMTASDAKNVLGSSRKYCIPLLEHLDKAGFTVRRGDLRELK